MAHLFRNDFLVVRFRGTGYEAGLRTEMAALPHLRDFPACQVQRQGPVAVARSDPERFTAALPKRRRKVAFIDYLRNQRCARTDAPLAAPIT
jgi:hypothetical protein